MKQRPVLIATVLIGIGVVLGVVMVTVLTSGSISSAFAGGVNDIGAKSAPIQLSPNVKGINDAFVMASKAVSPTVVSINVKTAKKAPRGGMDLFRFFGDPRMTPEDGGQGDDNIQRGEGSGSGVIISQDGYIVTNNHVIDEAEEGGIKVVLQDKREFKAKLIGKDKLTDLAVLKVEAVGLPVAHIGSTNDIQIGEWIIAVGNPLGLNSTVTTGIISAIGRGGLGLNSDQFGVENFIQTDAAINPGNSGGGMFSLSGSLIGINTAIASRTGYYQGYGFAIPIDIVKYVTLELINNGKVNRSYLGVTMKNSFDETDAKAVGLSKVEGVWVQDVLSNSPAKKAGLEAGDVILELDGTSLTSSNQLQSLVLLKKPGEKVKLKLWRDGKAIYKDVTLELRKTQDMSSNDSPSKGESNSDEDSNEPISLKSLGFTCGVLTDDAKAKTEVNSGVLVTKVDPYSEARERGLVPNTVIVKADRKEVSSPAQLKKIIESKKPGDVVLFVVKAKDRQQIISLEIPQKAN